ncbi:DNA alkylation repair protein [Cellulomonas hominis]
MGAMDELIDAAAVDRLRAHLQAAASGLRLDALRQAAHDVDGHKLRARTDLVARALLEDLPDDHTAAAAVVRRALTDPGLTGWAVWPVTEAVATLALASPDPTAFEDGLRLLAELTPRLTSEFAIRRFLLADLDRTLAVAAGWTTDPDPHVRRLSSEGTRPYLPWAVRVPALLTIPDATVPILDALHRDEDEVVRRSVANHLNDLSRHAPDLVARVAAHWLEAETTGAGSDPAATDPATTARTRAVVRHGLRTLVKQAHPGALELLGFAPATVRVGPILLAQTHVTTPGELVLAADLTNDGPRPAVLAVDYVVHYLKQNGSHRAKVFKLTTRTLAPGETTRVSTRHALRPMTTRVHHPGEHHVELQVNGVRYSRTAFELTLGD